jgi:ZIP family zinc transporter
VNGGALEAGFWGLLAGSALIIGALIGYFGHLPHRWISVVMAFGAGVLLGVLSFDLMAEAYRAGGLGATAFGLIAGALVFTAVDYYLARRGAKHRKRSGQQQAESDSDATAIAAGALLDGIPESIVIGLSLLYGGAVSVVAVIGIFVSNIPEGLSSATGMRRAGRSRRYVFGLWVGITLVSGAAALLGYSFFGGLPAEAVAVTLALAAGAVLAMVADTMMPEAFEGAHEFAGLMTVLGFLVAFVLAMARG